MKIIIKRKWLKINSYQPNYHSWVENLYAPPVIKPRLFMTDIELFFRDIVTDLKYWEYKYPCPIIGR